ncbi:sodium-dependent phosphate transport protein 1-like isoform X1 [Ostrea edulis]|nr:sodium-dependent phosphate transport protein 1-like isoform X1 [Ostrea edulis]
MDSTRSKDIANEGGKGSASFITNLDGTSNVPIPVGSPGHLSEGFLDKYLSCRWVVTYMCCLVFAVLPMLQNCLAMVLVCMESNYREIDQLKYSQLNVTDNLTVFQEQSIWNIRLEGDVRSQLLSAEFYAFPFSPLIGGYLSGRFSAKNIILVIIILLIASSSLTPIVLTINPYIAIGLRCIVGLSFGGLHASLTELLSKWAPLNERAQIVSTAMAGLLLGLILNYSASGFICTIPVHNGWPFIMYIFSFCCLVVIIPWFLLVYDSPYKHPRITPSEIEIIRYRRRDSTVAKMSRPPWLGILRSGPFWGLLCVNMSHAFIATTVGTYLPLYLNDVLHFDVTSNGLISSLPQVARFLSSIIGGRISDFLITREILSTTVVRKMFQTTGNILSVPFLIGLSYMDSSQATYAVILVVLFWFVQSLNTCSFRVNQIDIAPRFAGVLTGMTGTMAYVAALLSPIVTFELTKNRTQKEWQVVFFISSGVSVFCALVFLVLGSGLEQSWAKDPSLNIEVDVPVDGAVGDSSKSTMECHNHIATNGHILREMTVNGQAQAENGLGSERQSVQSDDKYRPKMISQSVQVNFGYGEINLNFEMNENFRNAQNSGASIISGVCFAGVSNSGEENYDTPNRVSKTDSLRIRNAEHSKDQFATSTLKINDTNGEITGL